MSASDLPPADLPAVHEVTVPADFSTADLLEYLEHRDSRAELARAKADERAEASRAAMVTSIDGMTVAIRQHNTDAEMRSGDMLAALRRRDLGGVAAVTELAALNAEAAKLEREEKVASRTWVQNAVQKASAEMWPLFRVPMGLFLAYWGARWSGALPAPTAAVSIVSTTSTPDDFSPQVTP